MDRGRPLPGYPYEITETLKTRGKQKGENVLKALAIRRYLLTAHILRVNSQSLVKSDRLDDYDNNLLRGYRLSLARKEFEVLGGEISR